MSLRESKITKDPAHRHNFSVLHFFTGVTIETCYYNKCRLFQVLFLEP